MDSSDVEQGLIKVSSSISRSFCGGDDSDGGSGDSSYDVAVLLQVTRLRGSALSAGLLLLSWWWCTVKGMPCPSPSN